MPGGQHAAPLTIPEESALWEAIIAHQNQALKTSGLGSKPGITFTYEIRGAEMFVSTRAKSITRATILYALRKGKGMQISGPKAIGVHGDSYIYAVFKVIGVIS